MIVITLTDCPPKLRGDLSKWLCEINTGVYVGNLSTRVRDELWLRVCQNLKNGRATMVYTTGNEQRMDFRVHNTNWEPVDLDGIKLMRRPLPTGENNGEPLASGFSKAAKRQMAQRAAQRAAKTYVVLDLETTGLEPSKDAILEYGALRVTAGKISERFSCLVRVGNALPPAIVELTGLRDELLKQQGSAPEQALDACLRFVGKDTVVGYNVAFDMEFLRQACVRHGHPIPTNRCVDLRTLARRKVFGLSDYKLQTLADHFSLGAVQQHRALPDCELAYQVYCKLMMNS